MIIFGASGSLAKLKIFPSLYELISEGRMPEEFKIVGYSRTAKTDEEFRAEFAESVKHEVENVDDKVLDELVSNVFYHTGQYDNHDDYVGLCERLKEIEETEDRVRVGYFSVPPSVFDDIIKGVGETLNKEDVELRLIFEKPFGENYATSKELKRKIFDQFERNQVFLLDHYLGKEAVFNLLSLRYANSIFSYLIQGKNIANIQITAMESVDIEGRAGYFDNVGILKDMVQSHLFQILAFLTMYIPRSFESKLVHQSKVHLLENMYFEGSSEDIVRGQYEGYRGHDGVDKDSNTETFVALKMGIDSTNWHGVPIYLRTGKSLKQKWTSVVIEFAPHQYQKKLGEGRTNKLVMILQPDESVSFHLLTKQGGRELQFDEEVTSKPIYCKGDCTSEHTRLLLECIAGDHMLFLDFPEIYEAWKIIDPIAEMFENDKVPLDMYEVGGIGPKSADELIERDGFKWHNFF